MASADEVRAEIRLLRAKLSKSRARASDYALRKYSIGQKSHSDDGHRSEVQRRVKCQLDDTMWKGINGG